MIKFAFILGITSTILSAWFFPDMNFGSENDNTNVDNSFVRDHQKEIVIDTSTSKIYYDSKPSQKVNFYSAWAYCQDMNHLGYQDWRVPTKKELVSILELSRTKVNVKHAFKNISNEKYWSSTEFNKDAWYFDFDLGRYSTHEPTYKHRTICVRSMTD
jgi:hypothetical protein